MNKKQLIVAWVMGATIFIEWIFILLNFNTLVGDYFGIYFLGETKHIPSPVNFFIFLSSPVLIIGGLLIYTLRDKKK